MKNCKKNLILRWELRPKLGYIFQQFFFLPTSKWYFMSCVACNLQCAAHFWETSINYNYSLLFTLNSLFFKFAIKLKLCGFVAGEFLLPTDCHSRTFDERPIWTWYKRREAIKNHDILLKVGIEAHWQTNSSR